MPSGWSISAESERDWLYLRVSPHPQQGADDTQFADAILSVATRQGSHRLIIELVDGLMLTSLLAGQLVVLHKRVHLQGGSLRLCSLSNFNRDVLRLMGVMDRFQAFPSRESAGRD